MDYRDRIIDLLQLERGQRVQCGDRVEWRYQGKLHRDHGPAVVRPDGTKEWWVHGKRHREDGPAVVEAHGMKFWYCHGKLRSVRWATGVHIDYDKRGLPILK